ncbi:MAG: hypothetical protein KatS3mg103_0599 [Phycisphaerales bacterium]|nr:MAG: hypothetical protein KatS3mg103_0599 [Phycisphaerales bacterium]
MAGRPALPPKRLDPARAQHAVAPAVRTHQGGMFGLSTLLVAMGFGLFVLGPLVVMGIVEAPPLLLVALVLAIACALILRGIARQHAGLVISSHGVRGDAFARLVQQARFECPLCDYDLAGLHDDQCPRMRLPAGAGRPRATRSKHGGARWPGHQPTRHGRPIAPGGLDGWAGACWRA